MVLNTLAGATIRVCLHLKGSLQTNVLMGFEKKLLQCYATGQLLSFIKENDMYQHCSLLDLLPGWVQLQL